MCGREEFCFLARREVKVYSVMIKVFQKEIDSGLKDKITNNSSIAYTIDIKNVERTDNELIKDLQVCKASANPNQIDLFYFESILASVGWNTNDDVFDPYELWAARNTAADKPVNLGHVQTDIVGHMTSSKAIADGEEIANDTDVTALPANFDIVVGAVVYRFWEDKDRRENIKTLIEEIKAGDWCVSMECIFPDFDYAVITPDGANKVIKRTDESSFLTKYLRIYGGEGTYQGHKIGRLLRNITFVGKGIVENPANKRSEVTAYSSTNEVSAFSGTVASSNFLPEETKAVEKELKFTAEEYNALAEQLGSAKAKITELDDKIKASATEVDAKAEIVKAKDLAIASLTTENEGLKSELNSVKAEIAKIKFESVKASRMSKLVERGVAEEKANSLVEKFSGLADEQFNELVEAFPAQAKKGCAEKDMEDEEDAKCSKSEEVSKASEELSKAEVKKTESTLAIPTQDLAGALLTKASSWISENIKPNKKNK